MKIKTLNEEQFEYYKILYSFPYHLYRLAVFCLHTKEQLLQFISSGNTHYNTNFTSIHIWLRFSSSDHGIEPSCVCVILLGNIMWIVPRGVSDNQTPCLTRENGYWITRTLPVCNLHASSVHIIKAWPMHSVMQA